MTTIYYLYDSRDGTQCPRYVGQTVKKLAKRLSGHLQDKTKCYKVNWINKVQQDGGAVGIIPIELVEDIDASEKERFWIKALLEAGYKLTNGTDGGEIGARPTEEVRLKISTSNKLKWEDQEYKAQHIVKCHARWRDPNQRSKASAAQKQRFSNVSERNKVSKVHKGKTISMEMKANISKAHKGKLVSDLTKSRLSERGVIYWRLVRLCAINR